MNAAVRRILETLDIEEARRAWAVVNPYAPAPGTDGEVLATLHVARTASEAMPLRRRAYSHAWLCERGMSLASQLPDKLKPAAQRLYPVTQEGVFLSFNFSRGLAPIKPLIHGRVERKVNEMYADGDTEPTLVKREILTTKADELNRLIGRMTVPDELKGRDIV